MTARRPALMMLREGNPGYRPQQRLEGGMRLTPQAPPEPDWARAVFPSLQGDRSQQERAQRLRRDARAEWNRVVSELNPQGLLARIDESLLLDHCVAVATARECYRDLALRGFSWKGVRGWQKNPATRVLAQQRGQLKHTVVQLGASPLARETASMMMTAHSIR